MSWQGRDVSWQGWGDVLAAVPLVLVEGQMSWQRGGDVLAGEPGVLAGAAVSWWGGGAVLGERARGPGEPADVLEGPARPRRSLPCSTPRRAHARISTTSRPPGVLAGPAPSRSASGGAPGRRSKITSHPEESPSPAR